MADVYADTYADQPTSLIGLPQVRVSAPAVTTASISLAAVTVAAPGLSAAISLPSVAVSAPVAASPFTVPAGQLHMDISGVYRPFIAIHMGFDGVWRNLADGAVVTATTPTVSSSRTIMDAVYGTRFNDGLAVSAVDIGATLIQTGTGNTTQHIASARMGAIDGIQFLQPGANTTNMFFDFPENTNPIYEALIPWRFNADQVTGATTTFYRVYPDATHGTTNISLQRTPTGMLRVIEAGAVGGELDLTSTTPLATGTAYMISLEVNATTKALTVNVYPMGSATPTFSLSGALLAPFVVKSFRCGNGNGTSNPSMDTNNWLTWGRASAIPRPDLGATQPGPLSTGFFPTPLLKYPLTGARGDYVVTSSGVISDADIRGKFIVQAGGVTLKNSIVRGPATYDVGVPTALVDCGSNVVSGFLMEDVTIVPDTPSAESVGIDGHDWTGRRLNLYNLQDCVRMRGSNITLEDSWLHDLTYFLVTADRATSLQTHNDLIQFIGAIGPRVRRNLLSSRYGSAGQFQPNINDNTGVLYGANNTHTESSAFMFNISSSGVPTTGAVIEDNIVLGGYTPQNSGNNGVAANLGRFWRNKFDSADKHGTPPITIRLQPDQTADTGDGTVNANVWLDGPNAGQEITVRHDG